MLHEPSAFDGSVIGSNTWPSGVWPPRRRAGGPGPSGRVAADGGQDGQRAIRAEADRAKPNRSTTRRTRAQLRRAVARRSPREIARRRQNAEPRQTRPEQQHAERAGARTSVGNAGARPAPRAAPPQTRAARWPRRTARTGAETSRASAPGPRSTRTTSRSERHDENQRGRIREPRQHRDDQHRARRKARNGARERARGGPDKTGPKGKSEHEHRRDRHGRWGIATVDSAAVRI